MLYFSKIKIITVLIVTTILTYFAFSNLVKFDDNFFKNKLNLGLDLQGGSYLLLEIDNTPVIDQKLQNLTITIKNFLKEKNIKINNLIAMFDFDNQGLVLHREKFFPV